LLVFCPFSLFAEITRKTVEDPVGVLKALTLLGADAGLQGSTSSDSNKVHEYLGLAVGTLAHANDFAEASAAADELERRLTLRTFLVGHKITSADLAVWGGIKSESVVQLSFLFFSLNRKLDGKRR
jgi:glutamyl-tRNA synthetase